MDYSLTLAAPAPRRASPQDQEAFYQAFAAQPSRLAQLQALLSRAWARRAASAERDHGLTQTAQAH